MIQTAKATVELTRNDEGLWLTVEHASHKATILLDAHSPLIRDILHTWAESQFQAKRPDPLQVLRDLIDAGHLGDHFYTIRESEGGWEGPRMLKWGKACEAARKLLPDSEI